jgi:hypothetical protein
MQIKLEIMSVSKAVDEYTNIFEQYDTMTHIHTHVWGLVTFSAKFAHKICII